MDGDVVGLASIDLVQESVKEGTVERGLVATVQDLHMEVARVGAHP